MFPLSFTSSIVWCVLNFTSTWIGIIADNSLSLCVASTGNTEPLEVDYAGRRNSQ